MTTAHRGAQEYTGGKALGEIYGRVRSRKEPARCIPGRLENSPLTDSGKGLDCPIGMRSACSGALLRIFRSGPIRHRPLPKLQAGGPPHFSARTVFSEDNTPFPNLVCPSPPPTPSPKTAASPHPHSDTPPEPPSATAPTAPPPSPQTSQTPPSHAPPQSPAWDTPSQTPPAAPPPNPPGHPTATPPNPPTPPASAPTSPSSQNQSPDAKQQSPCAAVYELNALSDTDEVNRVSDTV